ncbi:MAG: DUF5067 domain-containing protein [Clostridiales bacterium]|nr:DUF5067 domain-containing protein [Clostridiales bacterium]
MKKLVCITMIASLVLAAGCSSSPTDTSASSNTTSQQEQKAAPKSGYYFKDGELNIRDVNIKITNTKLFKQDDLRGEMMSNEGPVLLITYDFTNKTDEPMSPMIGFMACFQPTQETDKTIENLEPAPTVLDNPEYGPLFEMDMTDVKPGETVQSAALYSVKYPGKPVKVVVSQGMDKKLGEFTVDTASLAE